MGCLTPIVLKNSTPKPGGFLTNKVPCGRCPACLRRRQSVWCFRLQKEHLNSTTAAFVTYTYDDSKLPFSDNGLMTLNYRDIQLYTKRLRKFIHKEIGSIGPLKYYTVGEYGSNTYRPHYHSILFNVPGELLTVELDGRIRRCAPLEAVWRKGIVHVDDVNPATIGYVTKYMQKSTWLDRNRDDWDDRARERSLISKGLGASFLTPQLIAYYKERMLPYLLVEKGQKRPMPRYYRDKIFSESEKLQLNALIEAYHEDLEEYDDYKHEFEYIKQEMNMMSRKNLMSRNAF